MKSKLNPYIHSIKDAKQAMEFYKAIFGGELILNTFKDSGMNVEPEEENLVMHAQLDTAAGFTIMASDTPKEYQDQVKVGSNISISLSGDDEEELKGYWEKLSEGGTIAQPLEKAPWGDQFGMLEDRFGIKWMVNIAGKKA